MLRRSVFDDVPGRGCWGTAILIDGNIGIDGDPGALLRRCEALIRPEGGRIVVESHAGPRLPAVCRDGTAAARSFAGHRRA